MIATCSHVGHVFRKSTPYTFPGGTSKIVNHNNARLAEVWLDEWKEFYFSINPGYFLLKNSPKIWNWESCMKPSCLPPIASKIGVISDFSDFGAKITPKICIQKFKVLKTSLMEYCMVIFFRFLTKLFHINLYRNYSLMKF